MNVSKMILIVFFHLFNEFLRSVDAQCTINPEYSKVVQSAVEILLCTTADCKAGHKAYLETVRYYGCVLRTNNVLSGRHDARLKVVRKAQAGTTPTNCLDGSDWKATIANQACPALNEFEFKGFANIQDFDVYVISCDKFSDEIPFADKPRIQFFGFDNENQDTPRNRPVLFPTRTIKCVANCKELSPTIKVTDGTSFITINKNTLTINANIKKNDNIPMINSVCESGGQSRKLNFYIANNITAEIIAKDFGRDRSPLIFDVGEVIICIAFGQSSTSNTSGSPPSTYVALVTLDNSDSVEKYYTDKNSQQYTIPEGLTKQTYYSYCYFGNLSTSNLFTVLLQRISIGAYFTTRLQTEKGSFHNFDFSPGTKIWCDHDYYKNLNTSLNFSSVSISLSLFIIYSTNSSLPMSSLQNYLNKDWTNASSGQMVFKPQIKNKNMHAFCTINSYVTKPEQIFAGDRPNLTIVYIHPKWKTEYQLRGFILACVGRGVSDIEFTCMNCLPDMRMTITKVDSSTVELLVPQSIKKNSQITYKCTGYSNKYSSTDIKLDLNITVSEYTDIDTRNLFFGYGQDYIQCVSQFTFQSVKKEIIMPILVQVNAANNIKNKDGSEKKVLLEWYVPQGGNVAFQACCPPLGANREYSCLGKWKTVKVARNYYVKYNLDLKEIYPGNLLKCFICVNFTDDPKIRKCENENKIMSYITMIVSYPDKGVNSTGEQVEVHAPVEELMPNKEGYYKITDYEVKIGCKVRETTDMQIIYMKSCNINPPNIHINPPDKTMFVVGEIFSCTTDDINCKNGLGYTIYVQRDNEPAEKKDSHSFTLSLRHIGNSIRIKCAAGEGEAKVDTRLIRVEISPYNVSIPDVPVIMIYGNFLRCLASGFPPPSIKWTQLKGSSVLRLSETFVLIGPWIFPGDYMMQCEAKNKRGSVITSASFKVFNPRIIFNDFSATFYVLIPSFTIMYILLLCLSLLLIFQENFFGVPFFSQNFTPTNIPVKKISVVKEPSIAISQESKT